MAHVIVAYNGSGNVVVIGTLDGKPYASEGGASRRARMVEDQHPGVRTLVVEITPFEEPLV